MNPASPSAANKPLFNADLFRREYAELLRAYIASGTEEHLLKANELGRRALESGISIMDVAVTHTSMIAEVLKGAFVPEPVQVVERGRSVLLECLVPFELSVRGFRELVEKIRVGAERDVATIFASARDGVVVFDQTGAALDSNPALSEMFGYEAAALKGRRITGPDADGPCLLTETDMRQLTERGYFEAEDHESYRIDGTSLIVRVSGARIGSWEEGGTWKAFAYVRDVTERARAEQALRESEERYRTLFEAGGTSKCVVEPDLRISSCNLELSNLTRHDAADIAGKDLREFVHPEDAELLKRTYDEILRGGIEGPTHFETRIIRKDGFHVDVIAFMVALPKRDSVLVSFADITLEKMYEKQLEERAKQLSDFLSIASHELGLPVTIIKGYTQTLEQHRETFSEKEVAEILSSITAAADRLNHLVQELLDVSRVETGRIVVQRDNVELEPLLLEVVKEMQIRSDTHLFNIRMAPSADVVSADPEKLRRVMMILLDNASRFSPPGSIIEVETSREPQGVALAVLDRGSGVPPDERERIFEPFSQVEDLDHHSSSGLGLGLYIASRLVSAHGGRLWHEDRPGGGSIFRFLLPASQADA